MNLNNPQRFEFIQKAFEDSSRTPGHIIEFGVGPGGSLRHLSKISPRKVFGFDSFEGLPENWAMTKHLILAAGSFKYDPPEIPNTELIIGWFEDTIPQWKEDYPNPVAFLHIDADLYSSCKTILTLLNDRIIPGTVILFDEMYGYDNYKEGEWKAYTEWCEENNRKTYELGVNHTQAAHRVIV